MLQIISGKFFETDVDRHVHQGKGILYSNFWWLQPVDTFIGTMEPVEYNREINSFVFSYVNQIEKDKVLVRTGDDEIREHFILICTFGLKAYFSSLREEVSQVCARKPGGTGHYAPTDFISRVFDLNRCGTLEEVEEFKRLVKHIIHLPRKQYKAVIGAMRTFRDALLATRYNIDLAYSMLVYSLEALTQEFDAFEAKWDDYDENLRLALNKIFEKIDEAHSTAIKTQLIASSKLKASKRFVGFVGSHLSDNFYLQEANNTHPALRPSETPKSLLNAYALRSKFVHQLSPIVEQLRVPSVATGDVLYWENQPYLTLAGLVRVTHHVIKNFILSSPQIEAEKYNWRAELPGIIRLEMAPQYWIWKTENFTASDIKKRFSGFVSEVLQAIQSNKPITDLHELLKLFEKMLKGVNPDVRQTMLVIYWLYNSIIEPSSKMPNHEKIINDFEKEFEKCTLELMIACLILQNRIPWNFEECLIEYGKFEKTRFQRNSITLPRKLEIALIAELANMALAVNDSEGWNRLLGKAILESAGQETDQKALEAALADKQLIDIRAFLGFEKHENSKDEDV